MRSQHRYKVGSGSKPKWAGCCPEDSKFSLVVREAWEDQIFEGGSQRSERANIVMFYAQINDFRSFVSCRFLLPNWLRCHCEIGSTCIWSGPSWHLARLSTVTKQQIDLRWMGFFHRNQWFSPSPSRLTDFQQIFPDRFWVTKETQVPVARLGKSNEILTENVVTLDDMKSSLFFFGLNSPLLVILIQTCHKFTSWHRVVKIPVTRAPMNSDKNHNLWGAVWMVAMA